MIIKAIVNPRKISREISLLLLFTMTDINWIRKNSNLKEME